MNFTSSLRGRITVAFFLAAVGLSTILLVTVDFFAEDMETAYLSAHLEENMISMLEHARVDPNFRPPYSTAMRGYVFTRGQQRPPVAELADLSPGYQEVESGGLELHVLVADVGDKRYVLTYDGRSLEAAEETLVFWLVMGVVVVITVITSAGYWMSAQIAQPIAELSNSIEALDEAGSVFELHRGRSVPDEVVRLRDAFYDYSVRLAAFIERERSFTADVSHELRNPVMAAMNALDLLETRTDLDQKAVGQLARIRRSVTRMQSLIALFLGLARESGSHREAKAGTVVMTFDVVALAEDVIARYTDIAKSKGLVLHMHVRAHADGRGDSSMAAVVIENFIANAVQYTLTGTVDVVIDADGVSILDSGPGIASSERGTVLERLERGSVGNASSVAGFGLGLSIVKRICEHQGWMFALQSVPGQGTCVSISFA